MTAPSQSDHDFEDEVRRIARAKWPSARYSGAQMLEGRERDGIFETEDSINFVEATVSSGSGKAKDDARKLFKAIQEHNKSASLKAAIGWFVTRNEPTADQRKIVQETGKNQIRSVSFNQFQQSLIDVRAYLNARKSHFFGSVQDFLSGEKTPSVSFVEIGLTEASTDKSYFVDEIVNDVLAGVHFAIEGQYGAGKSMTLREIFFRLEALYIKNTTRKFPIYINLREHSGQRDPVELIERHARSIGFDSPSSLVRAWRGGFAVLLVDGFDEVTSLGVQGTWKKLKDLRMRSLEGVRGLIRDSVDIGVVVCGRSHYFESPSELSKALGLRGTKVLRVDEFNEEQLRSFLSRIPQSSLERDFPNWLPTRPLLLGYLASKDLLNDLVTKDAVFDAVGGWDYLLGRIYEREERIETNLDGETLRQILERAATLARNSEDRLGPISRTDLFSAFREVCGYEPDEQGVLAIQRLPGLGIYRAEDESRCFVDSELAEVCNGRELFRFLETPYESANNAIWVETMNVCDRPIGFIGAEYTSRKLRSSPDARGIIRQAVAFLNSRSDLACTRGDVGAVVISGDIELDLPFAVKGMTYSGMAIEFDSESPDLHCLSFSNCIFNHIDLDSNALASRLPRFDNCIIERISGRVSLQDLPSDKFVESCEVILFESSGTSGAIRARDMSTGEKVLLITLRKLFVQSLSGRVESALFRGLDVDQRRCVPEILNLLKRHELATEYSRGDGVIWLPSRKALYRVKQILRAPNECGEDIVRESRLID